MSFLKTIVVPLVPVILLLALWQLASSAGMINSVLFSSPVDIAETMASLALGDHSPSLGTHVFVTLQRLALAFGLGTTLGFLAGIAMGRFPVVHDFLDPLIIFCLPIPGIAIAPLVLVWVGYGGPCVVIVGAIAAFFPAAQNSAQGLRDISPNYLRAARIMGTGPVEMFFRIRLPAAARFFYLGAKLGLVRCWRTIVAVELIAATSHGLGFMIWDAAEYMQMSTVYGGVLLLAGMYFLIERLLFIPLERVTIHRWGVGLD